MTTTTNKRRVINYLEYDYTKVKGEVNTQPSETVPNQAYTVTEVLQRFSQGTLPNIAKPIYYDDSEDYDADDPIMNPAFDLVDAENILNDIKNNLEREKENNQNSPQNTDKIESKTLNNDDEIINDDEKSV